jgi:hypothetical protein
MIQAGEITAIVGDASRDGIGGTQYCGLWSLTSKHWPFNAFGNTYAGLLPGEIRSKAPKLEIVNATTCALAKRATKQYPVDVRATYQVKAPYYVDHVLRFTDHESMLSSRMYPGADFREVSWCCYMNCPADPRLHFLSGGKWYRYISPLHGVGSRITPGYISDGELEMFPPQKDRQPFHTDRIRDRFDEPFYYGRVDKMVLILIFDQPRWIRFFCSPSGGGESLRLGDACPAWDFEYVIPAREYKVGRRYEVRMRLVYKKYESDDDVLREYHKAQKDLRFERPGKR